MAIEEGFFGPVSEAGFDSIRLPMRWDTRAATSAPWTIDHLFFARVDELVEMVVANDLAIIIDFHHFEDLYSDPVGHSTDLEGARIPPIRHDPLSRGHDRRVQRRQRSWDGTARTGRRPSPRGSTRWPCQCTRRRRREQPGSARLGNAAPSTCRGQRAHHGGRHSHRGLWRPDRERPRRHPAVELAGHPGGAHRTGQPGEDLSPPNPPPLVQIES